MDELAQWISEARKKGYSADAIRDMLKKRGYDEKVIAEYLDTQNIAPQKYLIFGVIAVIVVLGAIILFVLSSSNAPVSAERVAAGIPGHVLIEAQVSGTIEVFLPKVSGDTILMSNKSIVREFNIMLPSQGIVIEAHTVAAPATVVPNDREIKLAALASLNLLTDIPEQYKLGAASLYSVRKDIIIWQGKDKLVKGNLVKAEHLGIGEVAVIKTANQYTELPVFTDAAAKADVYYKSKTEDYEIEDYLVSIPLTKQQRIGQESIPYAVPAGAAAAHDGGIFGMFVERDGKMYLIPAALLLGLKSE
ncbi:hypothetical protein HYV81_05515 [Candidatus Woesearchaeota archaeon]|nr:hypothetical protein [Candidatus Woesearchaeota archaeon]